VVAYDYPGFFSLITGLLGASGFNVLSGHIFTSRPESSMRTRRPRLYERRMKHKLAATPRRYIIDHFSGTLDEDAPSDWLADFRQRLVHVASLLEQGGADGAAEARRFVYEELARRISRLESQSLPALYPVQIDVDNAGAFTTLRVTSQDTPFFLYSLANALALRGITIERVTITTTAGQVSDVIDVLDRNGHKIDDEAALDELRFSVLLTKQFTFFLENSPNPYAALSRFEQLTEEIFHAPDRSRWMSRFAAPGSLKDLGRILGASDFIWEDFIRTQHEQLLPLLGLDGTRQRTDFSRAALRERMESALAGASTQDEIRRALNDWKDREIFQIDLEHILDAGEGVRGLAEPLCRVAELAVGRAFETVYAGLVERYGRPRTVGGLDSAHVICGLGKLGGVALGYASDIELLFVYADSGRTDGETQIDNAEFFEKLVQDSSNFISAKREGVFQIDLRLRPYGKSGPLACSLESFCRYYGPNGPALSYERLALVRLRRIAGNADLGRRVERLRDEFVYETRSISLPELHELREKQLHVKAPGAKLNAKFSPGALVDLEYCVQMLQITHGGGHASLRTPRIHEALEALSGIGVLAVEESRRLTDAYYFLRRLINALRMLRGNALDLFLPDPESLEYRHLARRMGYQRRLELDAGKQLFVDFETQTAVVRRFVGRHFGREHIPGSGQGNVVDLLLSDAPPDSLRDAVLGKMGFKDRLRAYVNLRALAGDDGQLETFCRLAVLAGDMLRFVPDPDMALNNWERFVGTVSEPTEHYSRMLLQPRRLEILLGVLATSQFLADTLERNPDFMDWVTDPEVLNRNVDRDYYLREYKRFTAAAQTHDARLNAMRRFRRREILRISIRDVLLNVPVLQVTREIAALAETILTRAVEDAYVVLAESESSTDVPPLADFCILALGKLGGRELNYSSDIDLIGVFETQEDDPDGNGARQQFYARLLERVRHTLTKHTREGYVYRVDFRLRPYGRSGPLAQSTDATLRYYRNHAALWELQALIKARPVAGNLQVGEQLLAELRPAIAAPRSAADVAASVRHMRDAAVKIHVPDGVTDVKTGPGGIRDTEFLIQGLQLRHLATHPDLFEANTIEAICRLVGAGILPEDEAEQLTQHYTFLRRVEHFLQILEDRQSHTLPKEPAQLATLAKRVLGPQCETEQFLETLDEIMTQSRTLFDRYISVDAGRGG
jgi:glutamate-ammonia-ligase adenylyltransferase